jgi:RNA polymerase sigma factor (sigma-70 family)
MNATEFGHIVARARQVALQVSHRYGIDEDTSEDVAQDTTLRLWTLHEELDASKPIDAIATVVARHLTIDLLRKRHKEVPIDTQWSLEDKQARPDANAEDIDNMEWLEQRLAQLPSTEYQVLRLRQTEGMGNEEIAHLLGISVGSVATLLSRARKRLLNEMKRRMKR